MREMADGSVDAVVTDPPYCSGGFSETSRKQAKGQGLRSETIRSEGWFTSDNMGTAGLVWLLRSVAAEAFRILRPASSMCVFTDWRQLVNVAPALESVGFRLSNIVVWDKGNAGLGQGFRAQHEMVLHLTKSGAKYHDCSTGNVLRVPRQSSATREHQTQKPVELMGRLVRVVAPVGGTILDPFCGSGSTGVAAANEGRGFVGIERSGEYCEIARRRIAEAQNQLTLEVA
jgi:DNA modification methylase